MAAVYYDSETGCIEITGTEDAVTSLYFIEERKLTTGKVPALLGACLEQLEEYFKGKRREFSVPLQPEGTEFQKKVWNELINIPFGKTVSYLDIARALGDPNATRAVGAANGRNPISIIIPCHRVVGHNGALTGYGGGIHRKEWLLEHERHILHGKQEALF